MAVSSLKGDPAEPDGSLLQRAKEQREAPGGPFDDLEPLRELPLLSLLPEAVAALVMELLEPRHYSFGEVVIEQGGSPDSVFLITRGSARVVMTGDDGAEANLALLGPQDSFGEEGLLTGAPRSATIRASSELDVLVLPRRIYQAVERVHPQIRHSLETQRRARVLHRFLRSQSAFSKLPLAGITEMLNWIEREHYDAGEVVVTEGDLADALYIVEDGRLRASRGEEGDSTDLGYLRTGDVFGIRAIEPGQTRGASVETLSECTLLRLPAERLRDLAASYPQVGTRIAEIEASYERQESGTVPLDFADELLPAAANTVSPLETTDQRAPTEADPSLSEASELDGSTLDAVLRKERTPKRRHREDSSDISGLQRSWSGRVRQPFVRQLDAMDCGAACLGMVAKAYGHSVSMTFIRKAAGTSVGGTTLRGLRQGGAAMGFGVEAFRVSPERLGELPVPAIVHWEGNHWIVLYDVKGHWVHVADPDLGSRKLTRAEFERGWTGYVAILSPTSALAQAPRARSGLHWLTPFLRPHLRLFVLATLLALGAAAAQVSLPVLTNFIVENGILRHDNGLVTALGLTAIGMAIVYALFAYAERRSLTRAAVSLDTTSLNHLTQTMLGLPMSYFESRRTGDLERRMSSLQQMNNVVTRQGVLALSSITQLLMIVAILLVFSPFLTLIFVLMLCLFGGSIRYSMKRVGPVYASLEHAFARYASRQLDLLKGVETVKVSGDRAGTRHALARMLDQLGVKRHDADRAGGRFSAGIAVVGTAMLALFVYLGAVWVLDGRFNLGEYLAFNMLVALAVPHAQNLALAWDDVQHSSVLLQRLQDVFEQEPEQADRIGRLRSVPSLQGHVELKNVSFSFGTPTRDDRPESQAEVAPILSDIELDVVPGTRVGLVGRSGSGKSTLLRVLAGLLEPTGGIVRYDSVDLHTLDYADLRRKIGFVLQQPYVFSLSITENVAFGDPSPDPDRVRQAAELADAHDFIARLPLGYATPIGDSGLRLSGGQAQRIAIARALYWDPAVLLLDEATSSLDSEAERIVKQNLDRVMRGRTAFIVAHRLSTVRDADQIVVLENGHLVEQGTHEELMRREGLYAYLYAQQVSEI